MTVIEWSPPPGAKPDWLMGAGATRAERTAIWVGSFAGVAFVASEWWFRRPAGWTWWQYLIAAVIAFDLTGGAVSNSANSTKRQYFGPPSPAPSKPVRLLRDPVAFAALHVYPFVIVALFPHGSWVWAAATYAGMLIGVMVVHRVVPQYMQRPTAMLWFCSAIVISVIGARTPPGWDWFLAVYMAKLVLAHSVREEPYRPHPGT